MIKIICVGNIKESNLKEVAYDYQKRLEKYTRLNIIELKEVTNSTKEVILLKERDNIMKYITDKDYIIVLDINGNELTSKELSEKINSIQNESKNIVFIIGSSEGLHQDIKDKSDYLLSFSKLTFPHQLFRVVLLEQIYRSFKILNNETYHK